MNKFFKSWQLIALSVMMSVTVSCSEDEPETPENKNKKPFLIETTVKNPDGQSGASYAQFITDFSGKVDNTNAMQLGLNAYFTIKGKEIFEFPDLVGQSSILKKYAYTGEKMELKGSLDLPPNSGAFNFTKINNDKLYLLMYSLGKIWIVNPNTMKKTGEIDLKEYAYKDQNPDPTTGYVRNGKYYLVLGQMNPATYMPYADYPKVDVLVIDPKTDKVIKNISENKTGLTYPRPYENTIFATEDNDIYIACTGFYGFNPSNKKNGFVCIPSGKEEFDSSKSWDISNTIIEGTPYKSSSIWNAKYIGNGKVLAYAYISELVGSNPLVAKNLMPIVCDLKTKTIKKIEGLPTTDGHSVYFGKYKNEYVFTIYGEEKAGFYTYNPKTEKVKLALETVGNPIFFHYFE